MIVRFKLDLCGVKIKLRQWNDLSRRLRRLLLELATDTPDQRRQFRELLLTECPAAIRNQHLADPCTSLAGDTPVPACVSDAIAMIDRGPPSDAAWTRLRPIERFALGKLSKDAIAHRNLGAALDEFGL